jgi:hypothetical protein
VARIVKIRAEDPGARLPRPVPGLTSLASPPERPSVVHARRTLHGSALPPATGLFLDGMWHALILHTRVAS